MKPLPSLVLIIATTLAGGAVGLGGGYLFGNQVPGFYRSFFEEPRPRQIDEQPRTRRIDPEAMGMGQGLTLGVVVGFLIGAVVVLATAWRSHRSELRQVLEALHIEVHEFRIAILRLEEPLLRVESQRGPPRGSTS